MVRGFTNQNLHFQSHIIERIVKMVRERLRMFDVVCEGTHHGI